jgi:hypothetical protein
VKLTAPVTVSAIMPSRSASDSYGDVTNRVDGDD